MIRCDGDLYSPYDYDNDYYFYDDDYYLNDDAYYSPYFFNPYYSYYGGFDDDYYNDGCERPVCLID